jgi:hypothetical protein
VTPARATPGWRSVRALLVATAILVAAGGAAAYLYDPPWVAGTTSGFRRWEIEPPGIRFRWTSGHATFYVPSGATQMTLPLRSQFPGPGGAPVLVGVTVDGRALTTVVLDNPEVWVRQVLPLPRRATRRRSRRVDLRVSRTAGDLILGVQAGEISLESADSSTR